MIQRGITQNSWLWRVAAGSSWVVSILNLVFQTEIILDLRILVFQAVRILEVLL